MDDNSLIANRTINESGAKEKRREAVLRVYQYDPVKLLTDRQVLGVLFPKSDDINKVQPRITELLNRPYEELEKDGDIRDSLTGRPVRQCRIRQGPKGQQSLF